MSEAIQQLRERRCDCCNRTFIAAVEHSYKLGFKGKTKWFCKYTCMVKYREENKLIKPKRRKL